MDVGPCGAKGSEKNDPEDPDAWEAEISKTGKWGDYVFSDGSLLEGGNVGGVAFVVKEGGAEEEVECGIGDVATVWDGEVAGMAEGLARTQRERKS